MASEKGTKKGIVMIPFFIYLNDQKGSQKQDRGIY